MKEKKYRLLIVDDSKLAAFVLKDIVMELDNIEVVGEARNGLEAIRLYKKLRPDITTMDLVMPGMSGEQAIKRILEFDEEAKIIVVSSIGSSQDKFIEQLQAGVLNVISKPYKEETIKHALSKLVDQA